MTNFSFLITICLTVFVSARLTPKLPFDLQNPESAFKFSQKVCLKYYKFYTSDEKGRQSATNAFKAHFGGKGDWYDDNTEISDFGKKAVSGFGVIRHAVLISRTILTFSPGDHDSDPCSFTIGNGFDYGEDWIEYENVLYAALSDLGKGSKLTITSRVTFNNFHDQKPNTVRFIVRTSSDRSYIMGHVVDYGVSMSTTMVDAAAYFNLIEDELENENRNLEIIQKMFYVIIIGIVVLFTIIIAFCTKWMVNKCNYSKYKQVSNMSDSQL